jgi:hypothetical protein
LVWFWSGSHTIGSLNCRRPRHCWTWVRYVGDRGDKEELVGLLTSGGWGRQRPESKKDGGGVSGRLWSHSTTSFWRLARVRKRRRACGLVRWSPRRCQLTQEVLMGNESGSGAWLGRQAFNGDSARWSEGARRGAGELGHAAR